MTRLIPYLFVGIILIHALPSLAVFAPTRLSSLYGFDASDSVLTSLLHHRALLFCLVSSALIWAIFTPSVRMHVLIGASISMAGFIVIAALHGELSGSLRTIVIADAIGLIFAAIAAILLFKGS